VVLAGSFCLGQAAWPPLDFAKGMVYRDVINAARRPAGGIFK
jgi:hypothetical protein